MYISHDLLGDSIDPIIKATDMFDKKSDSCSVCFLFNTILTCTNIIQGILFVSRL